MTLVEMRVDERPEPVRGRRIRHERPYSVVWNLVTAVRTG